jgi:hypothetical protein
MLMAMGSCAWAIDVEPKLRSNNHALLSKTLINTRTTREDNN